MKSNLSGTTIIVSHPDHPGEELLLIEVDIDCPACGQQQLRFAGHHIPSLLRFLSQVVEEHQELIGAADTQVLKRTTWGGTAPSRPEDN